MITLYFTNHTGSKLWRVLEVHNFLGAGNYGTLNSTTSLGSECCSTDVGLLLNGSYYTVRKPQHTSASIEAMWRADDSGRGTIQYSTI